MQHKFVLKTLILRYSIHVDDGLSCHHIEYNFLYLLHVMIIDDRRHKNKNNFT